MFLSKRKHPRFFCYFLFERKSISYFELSRLLVRDNLKHFYSSLKLALHCVGIDIHLSHIALNRCACNELALLVVLLEHNATSLRQIDEHGVALCSFLYAECQTTSALERRAGILVEAIHSAEHISRLHLECKILRIDRVYHKLTNSTPALLVRLQLAHAHITSFYGIACAIKKRILCRNL